MAEIENLYFNLLNRSVDSFESTTKPCLDTESKIVDTFAKEVEKDIPFEQKQYYAEQMVDAVERMEKKDTEHRATMDKIVKYGGIALAVGLSILASVFLGVNNDRFKMKN